MDAKTCTDSPEVIEYRGARRRIIFRKTAAGLVAHGQTAGGWGKLYEAKEVARTLLNDEQLKIVS